MMRLLLATDGTAGASTAVDLVASLDWPADVVVDVVSVVTSGTSVGFAFAPVPGLPVDDAERDDAALAAAREAAARLAGRGIHATAKVLHGHEADAIIQRAIETEAAIIVCGSRGRGPIRTRILGSVSAALVERAPCSVLVARHPSVHAAVLATDGSGSALAAERLVVRLPMFARTPIDLVTVAEASMGDHSPLPAEMARALGLQHETGDRLRRCGRSVQEQLLTGDPGSRIVAAADDDHADLIVLGIHGRSMRERLRIGSVTQAVLTHSHASLLVARDPVLRTGRDGGARERIEPMLATGRLSLRCA